MALPAEPKTRPENPRLPPDFSIIEKSSKIRSVGNADESNYLREQNTLENAKNELKIGEMRQAIELRNTFGKQIFWYLWMFSGFCGVILVLQGFGLFGFKLDTSVVVTLVGGTAASAFGLISVVLAGLFKAAKY